MVASPTGSHWFISSEGRVRQLLRGDGGFTSDGLPGWRRLVSRLQLRLHLADAAAAYLTERPAAEPHRKIGSRYPVPSVWM